MNIKKEPSSFFILSILLLLFLVDIISAGLLYRPFFYTVLCWYCVQIRRPASGALVTVFWFALAFISLFYQGKWGLSLLYCIPAALLATQLSQSLYNSKITSVILLTGCLLAQLVLVEPVLLGLPVSAFYTFFILFVNIGIVIGLSYCD